MKGAADGGNGKTWSGLELAPLKQECLADGVAMVADPFVDTQCDRLGKLFIQSLRSVCPR